MTVKCILYAVLALPLDNVVQIMLHMTYDNFSHENDIIPASDWLFWLVNNFFCWSTHYIIDRHPKQMISYTAVLYFHTTLIIQYFGISLFQVY